MIQFHVGRRRNSHKQRGHKKVRGGTVSVPDYEESLDNEEKYAEREKLHRDSELGVRCSYYPRRKVTLEKKTRRAAASFIAFLFTPYLRDQRWYMHNSVIYTYKRAKSPCVNGKRPMGYV